MTSFPRRSVQRCPNVTSVSPGTKTHSGAETGDSMVHKLPRDERVPASMMPDLVCKHLV